jgi:uncharacterized protein YigE (DUF2233 family)
MEVPEALCLVLLREINATQWMPMYAPVHCFIENGLEKVLVAIKSPMLL